jgi:hypothetical protein
MTTTKIKTKMGQKDFILVHSNKQKTFFLLKLKTKKKMKNKNNFLAQK